MVEQSRFCPSQSVATLPQLLIKDLRHAHGMDNRIGHKAPSSSKITEMLLLFNSMLQDRKSNLQGLLRDNPSTSTHGGYSQVKGNP